MTRLLVKFVSSRARARARYLSLSLSLFLSARLPILGSRARSRALKDESASTLAGIFTFLFRELLDLSR